jgi:hypothetical protein
MAYFLPLRTLAPQQRAYEESLRPTGYQPRYAPGFYERFGEVRGSKPYRDAFESFFPTLVKRFEAALPRVETGKGYSFRGAERVETRWMESLKGAEERFKEERSRMSFAQRGERPWAYAPRVQTRTL